MNRENALQREWVHLEDDVFSSVSHLAGQIHVQSWRKRTTWSHHDTLGDRCRDDIEIKSSTGNPVDCLQKWNWCLRYKPIICQHHVTNFSIKFGCQQQDKRREITSSMGKLIHSFWCHLMQEPLWQHRKAPSLQKLFRSCGYATGPPLQRQGTSKGIINGRTRKWRNLPALEKLI